MQSSNSIFMVLAIVCGLAVAASDQPKCAKTACEYFDQSRGETRLTLKRSHCPPTKKWCCPDIVSRGRKKASLSFAEAYRFSCKQQSPQ
ncbi:hypothetical protein Pst134EA_015251 [Puccinia striiformis f. sp. tritici]|uniref:hypothetical protein n=1 Tax=Puccinia striiformis f. sp. tritici TaxID=168172 RepID=UPI002008E243|nr:hypothetical protein Pst134EA_015251 [Puccinia striiformis f. sp. tritici]KAH9463168.1 hypothetical protein Pst134EA_015251 [Puccinia striiformis f. sp. tritici]